MRLLTLVVTLFSSGAAFLDAQMNVTLCDASSLRAAIVSSAKAETQFIFQTAGIAIAWVPCGDFGWLDAHLNGPVFVVRLRPNAVQQSAGSSALDLMGRAFLSSDGDGRITDAYMDAIRVNANLYQTDTGTLLGCVIAHELGHLLLGPGHTPNGIMRTGWRGKETRAANKRWLTFNKNESARLRVGLQKALFPGQVFSALTADHAR